MELKELKIDEFETYVQKSILSNYCQTAGYAKLMEQNGYNSLFIGLIDEYNHTIAASLILVKKIDFFYKYAYAPKGFILDYSNKELIEIFTKKIKEYLKKKRIVFVKINPEIAIAEIDRKTKQKKYNWNIEIKNYLSDLGYIKLKDNIYFEAKFPKYNGILYLKKFDLKTLDKNTRNKIKRSQNKGLKIEKATPNDLPVLYEFIKRKKDKSLSYYQEYFQAFDRTDMDLFLVSLNTSEFLNNSKKNYDEELKRNNHYVLELNKNKNEKKLNLKMNSDQNLLNYKNDLLDAQNKIKKNEKIYIGGALVIKYKNRINIIMSGYDKNYKRFNPNYFLHYELFNYYKKNYAFADMNGLTGNFKKESPYYGLNEFKLGFKPKVYEFIGEYDLPISPILYKFYLKNGKLAKLFNKKNLKKTD